MVLFVSFRFETALLGASGKFYTIFKCIFLKLNFFSVNILIRLLISVEGNFLKFLY